MISSMLVNLENGGPPFRDFGLPSDSDDEGPKRIVRSQRDKMYQDLKEQIRVTGNARNIKDVTKLLTGNYVHFQQTILLPNEADSSAVNCDDSDPMFLRFSCPISRRGDLNDYMKAEVAGEKQPKELKSLFYVLRQSPIWSCFYTCTCYEGAKKGPCKHVLLYMKKQGFVRFPRHAVADVLVRKRKRERPSQA